MEVRKVGDDVTVGSTMDPKLRGVAELDALYLFVGVVRHRVVDGSGRLGLGLAGEKRPMRGWFLKCGFLFCFRGTL